MIYPELPGPCPHPDWKPGSGDMVSCTLCAEEFSGETMVATNHLWWRMRRVARDGGRLADTCQALRDENTQLLAENARLRRKLDK